MDCRRPCLALQAWAPAKKAATPMPGAPRMRMESRSRVPLRPGIAPESTACGDESLTHAPPGATSEILGPASTKPQASPAKQTASCANLRERRTAPATASTKPEARQAKLIATTHATDGRCEPTRPACNDERHPRRYPWSQSAIHHHAMMAVGASPCLGCAAGNPSDPRSHSLHATRRRRIRHRAAAQRV